LGDRLVGVRTIFIVLTQDGPQQVCQCPTFEPAIPRAHPRRPCR
jgi:hypothetical protein